MAAKLIQEKGILVKLLENGIRILVIKECKKISNLKIDIVSSSFQIIKGEINKINIIAQDINYKELLFDEFELVANQLKIKLNLSNKELYFENNPIINFKISLTQNSLRTILLSKSWNWIGNMISKKILNQEKYEDIIIRDGQLSMKVSNKNINIKKEEAINIKTEKGRVYLGNKTYTKIIQIPLEDKIYVEKIHIENNLINIFANSSISF
ncbi:hypothetical protein [Prochlorococcus marinus]|uniref:hypothetical protein n=1 Tax=Prochlorococcus marinus TaxID=1219 RepID=UPI0022B59363|nr:hypothetical protein [Prochlorococcus marinus]